MEKSVDYYMSLPYTVELKPDGKGYRASVKELRGCKATAKATESVEELWERLKEDQRRRIEELLELGEEVPEPPAKGLDPFWESFPGGLDEEEARAMLYGGGSTSFPLRVLADLWLRELRSAELWEAGESEMIPPKRGVRRLDGAVFGSEGDLHPVRLGKGRQGAWIRFGGTRTRRGYREVEVLDQPPRAEAALLAALTVLETSTVRDADFERLRGAVLEHIDVRPGLRGKDLREVLAVLPRGWFAAVKAAIDEEAEGLSPEERKRRFGQSWERWKRDPLLWKRSLIYSTALLRRLRPGSGDGPLGGQLDLLDGLRKRINGFLEEHRKLVAFLEYGTPERLPKAVGSARDQVKAAVLTDVGGLRHADVADELGVDVPEDRYAVDMKISQVGDLVRDGRVLLDRALGRGGWRRKAEEMKFEADRYTALDENEKRAEVLAESMGWTLEDARDLYRTNPELARFLATPLRP